MNLTNHHFTSIEMLNNFILQIDSSKNILIQMFCGSNDMPVIQNILDTLSTKLPKAKIIGTSTAGEILEGKILSEQILISVSTFDTTKLELFYYAKADSASGVIASERIIQEDTKACVVFAECFSNNTEAFLEVFKNKDKSIHVVGGVAGDNNKLIRTFVIKDNIVYFEGIVLASLNSHNLNTNANYSFNWSEVGKEMVVTKCVDNIIYEIDNQPVKKIFSHYLGKNILSDLPSSITTFPLIKIDKNIMIARSVIAVRPDDGFVYGGKFEEGDMVKFSIGNIEDFIYNIDSIKKKIQQKPSEGIYIYSCTGLNIFSNHHLEYEINLINDISTSCGFISYGEFFSKDNKNYLLNLTTATLSLSESDDINNYDAGNEEQDVRKSSKDASLVHLVNTIQEELNSNIDVLNQYKLAIDESSIVSKTSTSGIITYVNEQFCTISGYEREELIGNSHSIVHHPEVHTSVFRDMWTTISKGKIWRGTFKNLKKDGSNYYLKAVVLPLLDRNGIIIEYIAIRTDITELVLKEQLIKDNAIDKLTKAYNRESLLKLFEIKQDKFLLLILINIDSFSDINDYFGYSIGDKLLIQFTEQLSRIFNKDIYRVAADEFAIACDDMIKCDDFKIMIKEKIELLESVNYKIDHFDRTINITAAIARAKSSEVYNLAHTALKEAKEKNNKIIFFDNHILLKDKVKNNILIVEKIKSAIKHNRIIPYFQGIVDNKTKRIIKYEALMRLVDKDGKVLTPYHFMEHAKKAKLYSSLTRIMIDKTFKKFKDLTYSFSINLTIEDIMDNDTMEYLFDKIKTYNFRDRLTIEIIETEKIENFECISLFIEKIKYFGSKVAIDDFGSGYSNFSYLSKLRVDYIKIDGSLIVNIHKDNNQRITVESILMFAKKQNIITIAEFVETEEVYNVVTKLGIDFSQGYCFSKPQEELLCDGA